MDGRHSPFALVCGAPMVEVEATCVAVVGHPAVVASAAAACDAELWTTGVGGNGIEKRLGILNRLESDGGLRGGGKLADFLINTIVLVLLLTLARRPASELCVCMGNRDGTRLERRARMLACCYVS